MKEIVRRCHVAVYVVMGVVVVASGSSPSAYIRGTRHNSADSVPTSNLVCITEVAIRTILCIAGIIYYAYNLITDSQCIRYRDAFNKRF